MSGRERSASWYGSDRSDVTRSREQPSAQVEVGRKLDSMQGKQDSPLEPLHSNIEKTDSSLLPLCGSWLSAAPMSTVCEWVAPTTSMKVVVFYSSSCK